MAGDFEIWPLYLKNIVAHTFKDKERSTRSQGAWGETAKGAVARGLRQKLSEEEGWRQNVQGSTRVEVLGEERGRAHHQLIIWGNLTWKEWSWKKQESFKGIIPASLGCIYRQNTATNGEEEGMKEREVGCQAQVKTQKKETCSCKAISGLSHTYWLWHSGHTSSIAWSVVSCIYVTQLLCSFQTAISPHMLPDSAISWKIRFLFFWDLKNSLPPREITASQMTFYRTSPKIDQIF